MEFYFWCLVLALVMFAKGYKSVNRNIPYKEYLKTKHWQKTRNKTLARYNYKCVVCGTNKNLNVHHRTYKNLWHEKPSDLVVLCNYHHKLVHKK